MRYYKQIENGYIISVGNGGAGEEITEDEYMAIMEAIADRPRDTETVGHKLRIDLTWEAYEMEPVGEPDPTPEEILDILTGESE